MENDMSEAKPHSIKHMIMKKIITAIMIIVMAKMGTVPNFASAETIAKWGQSPFSLRPAAYRAEKSLSAAHRLNKGWHIRTAERLDYPGQDMVYNRLAYEKKLDAVIIPDLPVSARKKAFLKSIFLPRPGAYYDQFRVLAATEEAVFTIAAGIRSRANIEKRIIKAVNMGAKGILVTSGGGLIRRFFKYFGLNTVPVLLPMDSLKILSLIQEMRKADKIPDHISVWAVANPLAGNIDKEMFRLKEKISYGAEAIITQPPIIWSRFEQWWCRADDLGFTKQVPFVVGMPVINSVASLEQWLWLTGIGVLDPQAQELLKQFSKAELESEDAFLEFTTKRRLKLIEKIHKLPNIAGVHIMPVKAWRSLEARLEEMPAKGPLTETAPVINSAILSIKEFTDMEEAEPGTDLRGFQETVIKKAIDAAQIQIASGAKIARLHYDVIKPGKDGGSTPIVRADRPRDTTKLLTPQLLTEIKKAAEKRGIPLCVDVHLMEMHATKEIVQNYINAGANYVILHWEGFEGRKGKRDLADLMRFIKAEFTKDKYKDKECGVGLSCNPRARTDDILKFLGENELNEIIDIFQHMITYSGRGGQYYIAEALMNVRKLREQLPEDVLIQVDGGMEPLFSVGQAVKAGADIIVTGHAFFGNGEQVHEEFARNNDLLLESIQKGIEQIKEHEWDLLGEKDASKYYASKEASLLIRKIVRERENPKSPLVIGFGAGTTVRDWVLPHLIEEKIYGYLQDIEIKGFSSEPLTNEALSRYGILAGINERSKIDIMVMGAAAMDRDFYAMKGVHGAIAREKLLMLRAKKTIVIVNAGKLVPYLGNLPLSVEVSEESIVSVSDQLKLLGGKDPHPRTDIKGDLFRPNGTKNKVIIDVDFSVIDNPEELAEKLQEIDEVKAHGLFFVHSPPDYIIAGDESGGRKIKHFEPERTKNSLRPMEDYMISGWRHTQEQRRAMSGEEEEKTFPVFSMTEDFNIRDDKETFSELMTEVADAFIMYCRKLSPEEQSNFLYTYFLGHLISMKPDPTRDEEDAERWQHRHDISVREVERMLLDKWPHVYFAVLDNILCFAVQAHDLSDFLERILEPLEDIEEVQGFFHAMLRSLHRASNGEIFHKDSISDVDIQRIITEILEMAFEKNQRIRIRIGMFKKIVQRAYHIASAKGYFDKVEPEFVNRIRELFSNREPAIEPEGLALQEIAQAA